MMSRADVTRPAPCFKRLLVPAERGSSGLPGTANTSRPCSPAKQAVIREPEALERKVGSELAGEFLSDGRAVAGADNGDDGHVGKFEPALGVEEGRWRVHLGERRRIARLADGDETCP